MERKNPVNPMFYEMLACTGNELSFFLRCNACGFPQIVVCCVEALEDLYPGEHTIVSCDICGTEIPLSEAVQINGQENGGFLQ